MARGVPRRSFCTEAGARSCSDRQNLVVVKQYAGDDECVSNHADARRTGPRFALRAPGVLMLVRWSLDDTNDVLGEFWANILAAIAATTCICKLHGLCLSAPGATEPHIWLVLG